MKTATLDMTTGKPAGLLLRFSLPLIFGNLFQQMYTFVDTLIVSRRLGENALAALGAAEWLTFLMFGLIQGITQGFSVVIARRFGEGKGRGLEGNVRTAYGLSVAGAVVFLLLGQLGLGWILQLLGTPAQILKLTETYLRILYAGIPVSFAFNMTAAILRAFGNSRQPVKAVILSSFINIVLDIWFVMGLDYGIAGAAWATVIAQAAASLYAAAALRKVWKEVRQGYAGEYDGVGGVPQTAKQMLLLGIPMGLQNVITASGGLVVQSAANPFGVVFLAGYTAANKLYALLEVAASSYGYAVSTYTAQNVGAYADNPENKKRIKSGLQAACVIGVVTAAVMSLIMLVLGRRILALFLPGSAAGTGEMIQVGYRFLCLLACFFPFLYLLYIFRSYIQGTGQSVIPMLSSFVQVAMRAICALGLTRLIGCDGVFAGEAAAWIGADLFLLVYLRRKEMRGFVFPEQQKR